ncbi:MAG: hypothetical protein SFX18_13985 [Pirellulales bacterium]|nr:hypothetical protein [Pirellulales bacterium]
MTAKQKILDVLQQRLPEEATFHQAIQELYTWANVEEGLEQLKRGETIPDEEVWRIVLNLNPR